MSHAVPAQSATPKGWMVAGESEVYIHYPNGQGRSKLKLPKQLGVCTARNVNTVATLAAMAGEAVMPAKAPRGAASRPRAGRAASPAGRAGSESGWAAPARTARRPR